MTTVTERGVAQVVKAASAAGFHDPSDALSFVSAEDYIDADGRVDADGISTAVEALGKDKPHLLKARPRTRRPSADGGGREGPTKSGQIEERLRRIKEHTGIS
jgi:hypothetical protein